MEWETPLAVLSLEMTPLVNGSSLPSGRSSLLPMNFVSGKLEFSMFEFPKRQAHRYLLLAWYFLSVPVSQPLMVARQRTAT